MDKTSTELYSNTDRSYKLLILIFGIYFILKIIMIGLNNVYFNLSFTMVLFILMILVFKKQKRNYILIPMFLSLLYVFQNMMIGLGVNFSHIINMRHLQFVIVESSLFGIVAVFLLLNKAIVKHISKLEIIGGLLILTSSVYIFIGKPHLMTAFAYERDLLFIVLLVLLGKNVVKKTTDVDKFISFIFIIGLITAVFGFVERFFFGPLIWYKIFNLHIVLAAKGLQGLNHGGVIPSQLPTLWFTSIFGITFRRMASFFMEPVNISYFFAVPLVLSAVLKRKVYFIVFLLAVFLTFGKGGWLVSFIAIFSYIILKKFKSRYIFVYLITIMVCFVILLGFAYFRITPGTALPHLWGFMSIWSNIIHTPLGNGLGAGGNFATVFTDKNVYNILNTGAESGLATIVYKMGILGLVFYLGFFIILGNKLVEIGQQEAGRLGIVAFAAAGLVIGLFFGSVFQENSLGPQANHLILLISGVVIGTSKLKKEKINYR